VNTLVVSSGASILAALLALGCGGSTPSEEPHSPEAEAQPATFAEQVSLGQTLFGEHCAHCHGSSGQGGDGPRLVGLDQGALPLDPPPSAKFRKTQFKTVADVASFVVANMPPDKPGSLSGEQYYSVLAFDLSANGITLDAKLDAALAATLEIPRK
jgi:mono/diheme cytochrome c family protein